MKIAIIEDEYPAAQRLSALVNEYDPGIEVVACLATVEAAVNYIRQKPAPDLLLMDIQLADGVSFEIFRQVDCQIPVVFTTAYDKYAVEAFRLMSVDYILKPVTLDALAGAIKKLDTFTRRFSYAEFPAPVSRPSTLYKKRFVGRVGQRLFFINTQDIAFFEAENKVVFLVDTRGNKYIVEATLESLELILDPVVFFRVNRSFIVSLNAIQHITPVGSSRLQAVVAPAVNSEAIIISRERASVFREWVGA